MEDERPVASELKSAKLSDTLELPWPKVLQASLYDHVVHSFVNMGKIQLPYELVTGGPMYLGMLPLILDLTLLYADIVKYCNGFMFCIHFYH